MQQAFVNDTNTRKQFAEASRMAVLSELVDIETNPARARYLEKEYSARPRWIGNDHNGFYVYDFEYNAVHLTFYPATGPAGLGDWTVRLDCRFN